MIALQKQDEEKIDQDHLFRKGKNANVCNISTFLFDFNEETREFFYHCIIVFFV